MSALTTPTNSGQQHANAYLRTKVLTASPEELRLMLLDGAIKFARQGQEGMARKDHEAMFNGVSQCRNIVFELLTTIREDINAELAQQVKALYSFLYRHLIDASTEKSESKLAEVVDLLVYERETWVLLMQKLADERAASPGAALSPAPAPAGEPRPSLSLQG